MTVKTFSIDETIRVGERLASLLNKGDIIALIGDLGAGKTIFVKGLAKGLGIIEYNYVNSPTFTIIKEYNARFPLYHFDVYRLDEHSFLDTIDYKKYFYSDGITVIEWADKIKDILPEKYLEIRIENIKENERKIDFLGHGKRYMDLVKNGQWAL
ncbi:ATP/GTP hydrolase [Candidatus Omnitrophus magneticus]|uniref:tRNA threonylcarbamoyladenosine biosynthesis protein TsaE n=1 Tax=Candidatus Omnitrophus magneticus TaxID=1609969 RepID=A0A0F0CPJ3_9BACT|nr:ATP/GTP hydrolase [Candidatus Omnitrophus magneticus]